MTPWSMNRRLLVSLTGLIGGLWIAGVAASAIMIRHEIDEVFDSALEETAQRILPLAGRDLALRQEMAGADALPESDSNSGHEEYILYQVRDAAGRVLLRSHDASDVPFPAPLGQGFFDDGERRYFTQWSEAKSFAVQVAELPEERAEAVTAIWLGLLLPLAVMLPLTALAIRRTVARATEPVARLQHGLRTRDGSHLSPIDGEGLPQELVPAVHDINRLLGRLEAALEAERAFAANCAHELRNPIAAAQAQASVLAAGAGSEEEGRRAGGLVATLATLSRRIETMLEMARAESGMAMAREPMPLRDLVALVMTDWMRKPQASARLSFENIGTDPLVVTANADAVGIAVQNLIGNALKHSPPHSPVVVRLGPRAELAIRNECPVIAPGDLERLKERFHQSSSGAGKGAGLGLYIADTIARQSGARLDLYSPARGTAEGFEAVLRWTGAG